PSTPFAPGDPSTPLIDISSQPQVGGTAGSSSSTDLSALAFGPRGSEGSASASLDSTVIVQRGTPTTSPLASTDQGPAAPLPTSSDAIARDAPSASPLQQAVAILFTGTTSGLILLPVESQGVEGDEPRSAPPTAPGVNVERDAEVRAPEADGDLAATASAEGRPGKSVVEVSAPPTSTAVHAEGRPGGAVVEVATPASMAVDIEASSVVGVPEGPVAAASPSPEEDVAPDDGTPSWPAILSILGVVSILAIARWRQLGRAGARGEGWRARAAAGPREHSVGSCPGAVHARVLVLKVDDLVRAEPGR
ncbi:MAG: hypothetical protein WKF75_06280, partial [Singulisphaera sp.]